MLSVGIVAYRNEGQLLRCLDSLLRLPHAFSFEYIIISNDPADEMPTLRKQLRERRVCHHLVDHTENNIAMARNKVLSLASHEYVYFTDPDCEQQGDGVNKLFKYLSSCKDPSVVAVGGANHAPDEGPFLKNLNLLSENIFGHFNSTQMKKGGVGLEFVHHLSTSNVLYRKDAVIKRGGFNEKFARVGEDLELSLRLRKENQKLIFLRDNTVLHHHVPSFRAWVQKVFRYGQAQTLVLFENRQILKTHRLLPLALLALGVTLVGSMGVLPAVLFVSGYFCLLLLLALYYTYKKHELSVLVYYPILLSLTHVSYSLGQVHGLYRGCRQTMGRRG